LKWRQRSTALWLKQGDANSKYLHNLASARRKKNHIPLINIQADDPTNPPTMITHTPLILQEFNTFYRNLLGTPTPNLQRPNLEAIYPPPNTDYLRSLVDPITLHEIREAMFSLPKDKANRLDRFPIEFFQRYWEWVSLDLLSTITAFYHKKLDLWRINQAYITLIPKKANSVTPSDYRPISVLSAIPKIITKILATRLQ
jgi:hypothetical protein